MAAAIKGCVFNFIQEANFQQTTVSTQNGNHLDKERVGLIEREGGMKRRRRVVED